MKFLEKISDILPSFLDDIWRRAKMSDVALFEAAKFNSEKKNMIVLKFGQHNYLTISDEDDVRAKSLDTT